MQSLSRRLWMLSLVVLVLASAGGCVQETRSDESVKYTYALWAPVSILLGSVVGIAAGWFLRVASDRLGWGLMIAGAIGMVAGPAMLRDYAVVDSKGLDIRTGMPFIGTHETVQFDDVQGVRLTKETRRSRRSRSTSYYYYFDLKSGDSVKVRVSGHLRAEARQIIDQQLQARSIQVASEVFE